MANQRHNDRIRNAGILQQADGAMAQAVKRKPGRLAMARCQHASGREQLCELGAERGCWSART